MQSIELGDKACRSQRLDLCGHQGENDNPQNEIFEQDGTAGSINLRIQILEFFAQAFKKIPFPAWSPKQQEIVDAILRASKDKYYRIVSSALSACEEMIVAMRPEPGSSQTYLHKTVCSSKPFVHTSPQDKFPEKACNRCKCCRELGKIYRARDSPKGSAESWIPFDSILTSSAAGLSPEERLKSHP